MFSAEGRQLREWTVTDPQSYETMIAVYNLDASRKPDPGLFRPKQSPPVLPHDGHKLIDVNYYEKAQ